MYLKKIEEIYMAWFAGRKEREQYCNYIIISKIQIKNKEMQLT